MSMLRHLLFLVLLVLYPFRILLYWLNSFLVFLTKPGARLLLPGAIVAGVWGFGFQQIPMLEDLSYLVVSFPMGLATGVIEGSEGKAWADLIYSWRHLITCVVLFLAIRLVHDIIAAFISPLVHALPAPRRPLFPMAPLKIPKHVIKTVAASVSVKRLKKHRYRGNIADIQLRMPRHIQEVLARKPDQLEKPLLVSPPPPLVKQQTQGAPPPPTRRPEQIEQPVVLPPPLVRQPKPVAVLPVQPIPEPPLFSIDLPKTPEHIIETLAATVAVKAPMGRSYRGNIADIKLLLPKDIQDLLLPKLEPIEEQGTSPSAPVTDPAPLPPIDAEPIPLAPPDDLPPPAVSPPVAKLPPRRAVPASNPELAPSPSDGAPPRPMPPSEAKLPPRRRASEAQE